MNQSVRTVLLVAAALLMLFGTVGYAFDVVPDLHGDLIEIGVRPTVLGSTVLYLHFGVIAMLAFTSMTAAAAVQSVRGVAPARPPLAFVAVAYAVFGVLAFSRGHNPHHLGPVLMGLLLGAALLVPTREEPPA